MPPSADKAEGLRPIGEVLYGVSPNPDGEDYEIDGKYYEYSRYLRRIRNRKVSEETKVRRTNQLKEEVIPFWLRFKEISASELEELKAVYLKYNGPESIRQRCAQEFDEITAKIAASEDASILEDMEPSPVACSVHSTAALTYGRGASIQYRNMRNVLEPRANEISGEVPVISLVPLGAGDVIPHHNKNPDDDLSLNPTLLGLLHRMMDCKHAAQFMNLDDEKRDLRYYDYVKKPRWLKFIEQGLMSDASIGYGATAFFNDLLLLFRGTDDYYAYVLGSEHRLQCVMLEIHMKNLLKEMGSVGKQLLALYNAIDEQGFENWPDPEIVYFEDHYHPRSPVYDGSKPDKDTIRALAWEQLRLGQERVRDLRSRLASTASNTAETEHAPASDGEAPSNQESSKRAHEENAEPDEDSPDRGPKRQRSSHSASPGPSAPAAAPLGRAASKRPREPADDDDDHADQETEQAETVESRAAKRQRLTKAAAPSNLPITSSGVSGPSSYAAPPTRSTSKRARAPADDDDDDGADQGDGDSHGTSGSKRRRLTKDTSSAGFPVASPEVGPSNAGNSTSEPAAHVSGSSQAQASSSVGQAAPQQPQQPADFPVPSSQAFNSSSSTIAMKKIVKMGKSRPWVFGYGTDEGYGIYAFMKCPGQNCKHRFSGHPLKGNHVRDHLLSCGQPIADEQDMVRQYASQVIKDAGRVSDLTIDWARKSNMSLLPSNEKDNHPDNFPLSPAAE